MNDDDGDGGGDDDAIDAGGAGGGGGERGGGYRGRGGVQRITEQLMRLAVEQPAAPPLADGINSDGGGDV